MPLTLWEVVFSIMLRRSRRGSEKVSMDATTKDITLFLGIIEEMIQAGGPEEHEYDDVTKVCNSLWNRSMTIKEEADFYEAIKPLFSLDSMLGFSFLKPHGYAGDHELIDRIYQEWHSSDYFYHKWDKYYHYLDAPQAVRNRKDYLKDQILKIPSSEESPIVLNLASGPCTDLYEYFSENPDTNVKFDCLDLDPNALEYGAAVCDGYHNNIEFIHKNAFRYSTPKKYNLIWSAGLFDYFNDKLFTRLVNRMYDKLAKNGELVVGNFSPVNSSRGVQEVVCQWYLHHRDEKELLELALKAGVPKNKISINSEETGINLFMHMVK